jgi:hypothetical protein
VIEYGSGEQRFWLGERADLFAMAQQAAKGLTKACPELVEWVSPQTSLHKAISRAFFSGYADISPAAAEGGGSTSSKSK